MVVLLCAGCNTEDNSSTEEPIPVTFGELLNNPYAFESKKNQPYLFRLTGRHNFHFGTSNIIISGRSPEFGKVHFSIALNEHDNIYLQTIQRNLETGKYDYICNIKITRVHNTGSFIGIWAVLLSEPEREKI